MAKSNTAEMIQATGLNEKQGARLIDTAQEITGHELPKVLWARDGWDEKSGKQLRYLLAVRTGAKMTLPTSNPL